MVKKVVRAVVPKPNTIDFETMPIRQHPDYPPVPISVSIKYYGKKPKYLAWGHTRGQNNCTKEEAREQIVAAMKGEVLCHNSKFDLAICLRHFGIPIPSWDKIHDTMFLAYLSQPRSWTFGLKPLGKSLLGMDQDEKDAVSDWICANQPIPGRRVTPSKAGEFTAFAPSGVVGPYADGDTIRTEALFNKLYPEIVEAGMLEAYDRERKLVPILIANELQGVEVNLHQLRKDVEMYRKALFDLDIWIKKKLKVSDINLNSAPELGEALVRSGLADPKKLGVNSKGYQTNKEALSLAIKDTQFLNALLYRGRLSTCLGTFMEPWLAVASRTNGWIHTSWNQIKGEGGGTTTGRFSSSPNFQNIPNEFEPLFHPEVGEKGRVLPKPPVFLPPLPYVRKYIVPGKDRILIDRDYCFSPDTEILTEGGFVRFDELGTQAIAQWDQGSITYAQPTEYQLTTFEGELVNIVGDRSTDLLVTPNHQCLALKENRLERFRADEYPIGSGWQQIHAGILDGEISLPAKAVRLLAAIQADATLRPVSLQWKLKKTRKIERLHELLNYLGIEFKVFMFPSTPGYSTTQVLLSALPKWVEEYLGPSFKEFSRKLLTICPAQRLEFLMELAHWDGRRVDDGTKNWSYFTTHKSNGELVQELACLTGLRAGITYSQLKSGKTFTTVNMRTKLVTYTQTFTKKLVPYSGPVHCVSMPAGTVIVRRNGRVSVTCQSQQELRILGHFEAESLMESYLEDPWMDAHDTAKGKLEDIGLFYDRKPVKNTNFGIIYGQSAPSLAVMNNIDIASSKQLINAIKNDVFPGLKDLFTDLKERAKNDEPIRTWGGRVYYCEEPRYNEKLGYWQTFDYKLLNLLIQGSAADCTKEALIRWSDIKHEDDRFLLSVHDQETADTPVKRLHEAMKIMKDTMESLDFDVPMLSEGKAGYNWFDLKDYDKKGVMKWQ